MEEMFVFLLYSCITLLLVAVIKLWRTLRNEREDRSIAEKLWKKRVIELEEVIYKRVVDLKEVIDADSRASKTESEELWEKICHLETELNKESAVVDSCVQTDNKMCKVSTTPGSGEINLAIENGSQTDSTRTAVAVEDKNVGVMMSDDTKKSTREDKCTQTVDKVSGINASAQVEGVKVRMERGEQMVSPGDELVKSLEIVEVKPVIGEAMTAVQCEPDVREVKDNAVDQAGSKKGDTGYRGASQKTGWRFSALACFGKGKRN